MARYPVNIAAEPATAPNTPATVKAPGCEIPSESIAIAPAMAPTIPSMISIIIPLRRPNNLLAISPATAPTTIQVTSVISYTPRYDPCAEPDLFEYVERARKRSHATSLRTSALTPRQFQDSCTFDVSRS